MNVWLDCDTGHDDAYAILLAAYHPGANLLGISTTYGNAPLERTTYNTRAILKAIGKEHVPVYTGAARPYCREIACAPDIHGETGLDGTSHLPVPSVPARDDKPAVQAMYDVISATLPQSTWIVATGALTNVALLFSIYPALIDHIAGLSIMGGAIGDGFTDAQLGNVLGHGPRFGNWTPWAEFNIYIDPESARAVFENHGLAAKTVLIPLDLTHQFLATKDVQTKLSGARSETRILFHEILTFFAKTYAEVFGLTAGPPLHDPLAVAVVLASECFDDGRYDITVVTDGEHGSSAEVRAGTSQCGQTLATASKHGVRIPKTLNQDAIWTMLDECLSRAEQSQG
ncbi:hypothetical protein AMS68_001315 [Peltaster fructicola]|uniref:Inosine/uridine-preferring nucleoside hydrolase domain-containing protein n=1 Tax=Peltaster fructicola TaxID=286661 RepID=A0A6H0XMF0_9PEZI|nr:hypothetical protein AMS68_001315 [Peltaster fructicola]